MNYRPLTEIERQTEYLRRIGDMASPCPVCLKPSNWWEVSGISREKFTGYERSIEGHCPHCQTPLTDVVPFIGPPYLWAVRQLPPA